MPRLSSILLVALVATQLTGCISSVKTAPPTYPSEYQDDQGAPLQSVPGSAPSPVPNAPGYDDYDDRPLHNNNNNNNNNQYEPLPGPIESTRFFPKLKAKSVSVVKTTEDRVRNMFD